MNISELYENFYQEKSNSKKAAFDQRIINTKFELKGVKISDIENFVKNIAKQNISLDVLPLSCHEDILIKGALIAKQKDNQLKKKELENLLPYIDNWGSCDMICSRLKNMEDEEFFFENLLFSPNPFFKRFGIVWLKNFALKLNIKKIIKKILEVKDENYYVKMAQAWVIADGFVFDFENTFKIFKTCKDDFVVKKSISKARDSFRITKTNKEILKKYLEKWKEKKC